jgi:biotin carboxyl carrier protein
MRCPKPFSLTVAPLALVLLAATQSFGQTKPSPTVAKSKSKIVEIRVEPLSPGPDGHGMSLTKATVGHWFKKAGDTVAVDEPLVELETDEVTVEVPAPSAGTLGEIVAKDGETVAVGALLGRIYTSSGK